MRRLFSKILRNDPRLKIIFLLPDGAIGRKKRGEARFCAFCHFVTVIYDLYLIKNYDIY